MASLRCGCNAKAASSRGTKRSMGSCAKTGIAPALGRLAMTDFGCAPCNDAGVFASGKLTVRLQCQGCVIARHEAIHGRLCKDMDCHVAGRLAMTDFGCAACNDAGVFASGKLTVRLQCQGCVILRYREARSDPWAVVQRHGLPRRWAPRNDGFGCAACNDAGVFASGKLMVRLQCQGCVIAYMDAPCLANCLIDFRLDRRGCNRTFGL